ncbi:MAG: glutamate synthase small subunit [Desulfuromonas sp.]|nr:MAG: glutamate synthase small subunit [Desulfuromonas sp.]
MQSFVENNRREPQKVDLTERLKNFEEIYRFFNNRDVRKQADRCVQCGDPFCTSIGCPLQNHIPQWLEAIAARDLERAFLLSNESSPYPEILGRICPQSTLCEGACTLDDGYGAITIGAIEASITDLAFEAGLTIPFPSRATDMRVAVVGSGPAGMACAHFLLRAGIGVDMYERANRPGGLLTYGIPGFKLDKAIVERRFALWEKAGLRLHLNQELGGSLSLETLQCDYDAVFLGFGATRGRRAGLEGDQHEQVFLAMDYLTQIQRRAFSENWDHRYDLRGKRVVVVGGGDTAMDCLRTAVRDGASSVSCLYRRDQDNMPGSVKEFHNAIEEGVTFRFNESPQRILCDENGDLSGVSLLKTELTEPGADGRRQVRELPGSDHCVAADVVILALGFDTEEIPALSALGIETDRWGQVLVDARTGATSVDGVYAGGDCQRGADLAVTAAADGRRSALAMMERLLD